MSFKASLSVGQIGEFIYHQAHEGTLKRLDGRKADYECLVTGATRELKTDTYSMSKTPNMFIERYSDKAAGTPGGPYQALANGINQFVYFYVNDLTFFQFDTQALINKVEELRPSLRVVSVPNSSWITEGYLVPREFVADLATPKRIKVTLE